VLEEAAEANDPVRVPRYAIHTLFSCCRERFGISLCTVAQADFDATLLVSLW